jgi:hypothetical protein
MVLTRAVGTQGAERVGDFPCVMGKALQQGGVTIERHDGEVARDVADNRRKHGRERRSDVAIVLKLAGACTSDFAAAERDLQFGEWSHTYFDLVTEPFHEGGPPVERHPIENWVTL